MAVAFPCVNISVCWGCNRLGSWNSRSYFSHSSGGWKTRSGYKHVRVLGRALFLTCRQQPSLPVFTWPFSACIHCFCCSVAKSCLSLCDPMDCSIPGLLVLHYLPEFTRTHVHWVSDDIQPSHPLSSPSPAFNLSQHYGLFQWVGSLHQVAKVLECQLQYQSFQWIFRVDFL